MHLGTGGVQTKLEADSSKTLCMMIVMVVITAVIIMIVAVITMIVAVKMNVRA